MKAIDNKRWNNPELMARKCHLSFSLFEKQGNFTLKIPVFSALSGDKSSHLYYNNLYGLY
jgi:hypothetical protein